MPELKLKTNPDIAQNNGVINPYALAETVAGRRIAWNELPDVPRVLEDILQTPYEELFDPKYEGPLYMGLRLNKKGVLEPFRSPLLDVKLRMDVNDLEAPTGLDLEEIKSLADLGARFQVQDIATIAIQCARLVNRRILEVSLRIPDKDRLEQLARVFPKELVQTVAYDPETKGNANQDWTPANAAWEDRGDFFNEAAEFFDPIQGAVANCYYIAALSAVAWATPYKLAHMSRATGTGQQVFTNLIRFFKHDSGGQLDKEIEVTDAVPVNAATHNYIYCRSSEAGEIWPAVYEKAFAKLKTGTTTDHPDITATAWGDCVLATSQLNGGTRHYYDNHALSADDIWNLVRSHSLGGRTFDPMTCWTYGTAPDGLSYSDANIVASHCYTVLGWAYAHCKKYLILRNPWGSTEASVGQLGGTVWMHDISFWRPLTLTNPDGTFGIEASAFKQYYAGIGFAK